MDKNNTELKQQAVETAAVPKTDGKLEELPVKVTEETLPVLVDSVQETQPVVKEQLQIKNTLENTPKYTMDMPVEQILERMTFEEAQEVVVDTGVCKGWRICEVAERRAVSLKFYVYGGYKGPNNILRAAARLALDALTGQKKG